jgi:hypothetical protein
MAFVSDDAFASGAQEDDEWGTSTARPDDWGSAEPGDWGSAEPGDWGGAEPDAQWRDGPSDRDSSPPRKKPFTAPQSELKYTDVSAASSAASAAQDRPRIQLMTRDLLQELWPASQGDKDTNLHIGKIKTLLTVADVSRRELFVPVDHLMVSFDDEALEKLQKTNWDSTLSSLAGAVSYFMRTRWRLELALGALQFRADHDEQLVVLDESVSNVAKFASTFEVSAPPVPQITGDPISPLDKCLCNPEEQCLLYKMIKREYQLRMWISVDADLIATCEYGAFSLLRNEKEANQEHRLLKGLPAGESGYVYSPDDVAILIRMIGKSNPLMNEEARRKRAHEILLANRMLYIPPSKMFEFKRKQ